MSLPTIPTSFTPRLTPDAPQRARTGLGSIFGLFAYGVFALAFLSAAGVFLYSISLDRQISVIQDSLDTSEEQIDPTSIDMFSRFRTRLSTSQSLLAGHVIVSDFLSSFQKTIPVGVRLLNLHLAIDQGGGVKLEGSGVAKSFNTLAVASNALASDSRINDLIFSGISVNKDSTVAFSISASVDLKRNSPTL